VLALARTAPSREQIYWAATVTRFDGVQVLPPSVDFQTPPLRAGGETVFALRGSTTIAETQPEMTPALEPDVP
jgi:hypothetical protein